MDKDLIVIGGGPGGYVAAIRAAQLGAKVMLIEQQEVGGTCLNRGCIPTKALYRNAQMLNYLQEMDKFGITLEGYSFDMNTAQSRKQGIVSHLRGGIEQLLKSFGVEVLRGRGVPVSNSEVEVTTLDGGSQTNTTRNILLATGSQAVRLPVPGMDLPGVITSDEALVLDHIPKSMVIIGGGVVGLEFAGIFNSFGTDVTVIELLPRLLPNMDEEIVKRMTPLLKKKGIKIETGTAVKEILKAAEGLQVRAEGKKGHRDFPGELVLISAGRMPNLDGLNLDGLGMAFEKAGIKVDSRFSTSVPGIYAIGDVIGGKMLAHLASEQGKSVAESLFGSGAESASGQSGTDIRINDDAVPSCVFSFPELAAVGLTEEEAKEREIPYVVSKFLFAANGKALTMGESDGLVKVIAREDSKEVIGVHILGPHASDLIHEAVLAVQNGLTAEEIGHTVHAHPTLAESFHEAVLGLDNQAIHMVPRV